MFSINNNFSRINYSNNIINLTMNKLINDNIFFINQYFDSDFLIYIISNILFIQNKNINDITFLINCNDTEAQQSLILRDFIKNYKINVTVIGIGKVMNSALLLFSIGSAGRKMVFPNIILKLSSDKKELYKIYDNLRDYVTDISQYSLKLNRSIIKFNLISKMYDKKTDNTNNRIINISKKEAIELGIIDKVLSINN